MSSASVLDELLEKSQTKNLSQTKEWKNLLHWRWNLFDGIQSEADSTLFFFAKDGAENLKSELAATIKAFTTPVDNKKLDQHPICTFPARYLFLKKSISFDKYFPAPTCPAYNKFVKKISAKSISIVFSSYFISRPASAFGHTLMRFGKSTDISSDSKKYELLDYAANYSANVTTENALLYGIMGMAGGFKGEFASMPYFYKIREYNDYESRDLWDYHLNFTPIEIQRIVAHLWEMKVNHFRYFYLTENCSYHMLGLLDIANPELGLTDRVPYVVVPSDTIALLAETPGLLKGVTYRPSKLTRLKYRLSKLTKSEHITFDKVISNLTPQKMAGDTASKAKVLDTVIDYIDFKFAEKILFKNSEELKLKNKFLIQRAELGVTSPQLNVPSPDNEMPHLGHKTRRLAVGAGVSSRSDIFTKLEYRFAMHDLLDLSTGQNPNATMEMGHIQLRYNLEDKERGNSSSLRIDEVSIAKVYALTPMEKYFSDLSWKANFGGRTIKDGGCLDCFSPTSQIGMGITLKMGPVLTYLMGVTDLDFNRKLGRRGYRLAAGPEAKFLYRLGKTLTLDITGQWRRNFLVEINKSSYSYSSEIRFHTFRNLNFGIKYKRHHKYWDSIAKVFYYF